jgi:hypothetical protein
MDKETTQKRDQLLKTHYEMLTKNHALQQKIRKIRTSNQKLVIENLKLISLLKNS